MEASRKYLDPQTLARLRNLRLRGRHVVEGSVAGLHRSPFHGYSIEFAEHREYAPGDDMRHVDWKVYGRSDKLYLKQYEDEANLVCYLVLDGSASMCYRSSGASMSKLEYARRLAASLAYLVLQQQDAVALAVFDEKLRVFLPPSSAGEQLNRIVEELSKPAGDASTRTDAAFQELTERMHRRGVVIVLSDLLDDFDSTMRGLEFFLHRRHDVAVLQVLDPAELHFPFHEATRFRDLEGAADIATDPDAVRQSYLGELRRFLQTLQSACRGRQIDYRLAPTDAPLGDVLARFLSERMANVR